MAEDASYAEHRAEIAGLRNRPDGALRSGNFQYPSFPFRTPQELLENRVGHQQIVIVGGGLAGLTAAVDFGVRGIACVLLDDNNTVSLGSRSIAQGKRTMEIATRLGIAERMLPKGISWSKGNTLIQDKLLYSFDLSPEGEENIQAFLCLPQYYVEMMLVERAGEFPHVDLRWSSRVVDIAQDGDRVRLDVETPEGRYALTADWVIACDGVRSAVRRLLGVPFEGDKYVENFVICDVKMVFNFRRSACSRSTPRSIRATSRSCTSSRIRFGGSTGSSGPEDDPAEECKPEKVNKRLETMFGPDVPFETQFASIYSFEVRRVPNFRIGRVLFAGDAAPALAIWRRTRRKFGNPGCRQFGVEARACGSKPGERSV